MNDKKQIEEIADVLYESDKKRNVVICCGIEQVAEDIYNAGYRKQEWISVEERLPDGNGSFLTADEKGHMEVCYWEKRFGWFASSCNKNALTHWMPFPEPPKGGAE